MKIFSAQLKGTTIVVSGSTASITGSFTGSIAGIDINATNQFTASTIARLNSIETISSSNNSRVNSLESFSSSIFTTNTFTSSTSARLNSIETITASNISRLTSLESTSASVDTLNSTQNARLNSLETTSASVDTLNITQNTRLTNLELRTGSLATTGSNTFIGTQTITGSLFVSANLVVQGTSSLQNITASAVSIGTNIVNLNTANPAIRYAGLVIGDSGSVGGSGSFLYDSVQDEMIFVHRGISTVVTSSVTLMGPQTFDNVGNETYPTNNRIQKGTGNEHLVDSCISDTGTLVTVNSVTSSFSGLVGIGITTPRTPLHIIRGLGSDAFNIGESDANTRFAIGQEASYAGNYINSRNIDLKLQAYCAGGSGGNIHFQTGTDGTGCVTTKLFICSNGNVGLGTITPAFQLDLGGTGTTNQRIRLQRGTDDSGQNGLYGWNTITIQRTNVPLASTQTDFSIIQQGSDGSRTPFYISTCGDIGIGTTTPSNKLTISNNGNSIIAFRINDTNANGSFLSLNASNLDAAILAGGTSAIPFDIYTGGVARMRISCGGNVGIGASSPCARLHIQGASTGEDLLYFCTGGSVNTKFVYNIQSGADDAFVLRRNHTTQGNLCIMSWTYNGLVGIGTTTPCAALDINCNFGSIISATTRTNDACCSEVRVGWVGGTYTRMGYHPSSAVAYIDNTYPINSNQPFGDIQFRHNSSGTMVTRLLLKADGGIACFSGTVCTPRIVATEALLGNSYTCSFPVACVGGVYATVIPPNTLVSYGVYLAHISYDNGVAPPWAVNTAFIFKTVNTNGGGADNAVFPPSSTHQGGTGCWSFRMLAGGGQVTSGVQIQAHSFANNIGTATIFLSRLA